MASESATLPNSATNAPTSKLSTQSEGTSPNNNKTESITGTTCMELALEGERLCTTGDLENGVQFFEEAIKIGTNDDRTLSAIYSQLGNAFFHLENFQKALEYHKLDVTLVHNIGDDVAEAKACGNLGNTFKMLGKFDEAAVYCRRHLELSRKSGDKVGEGRALYNLGNVYHTQGKRMISSSEQEPGELSNDIRSTLQRAIEYYELNLKVVTELGDKVAMGRAFGNLGNTHYLLGNFDSAVESHKERLQLAKASGDQSAERRAYLNLGNANVFLGNFPQAIENYTATLKLSQELQDKHTEAHSCYSLANTYTFLCEYRSAIEYHLKYLDLIDGLNDKIGEGRACWSLVNLYQMVNDPEPALICAKKHYDIAAALGDKAGLASAKLNIGELEQTVAQKRAALATNGGGVNASNKPQSFISNHKQKSPEAHYLSPDKRQEQEQRKFKRQLKTNLTSDIESNLTTRREVMNRDGPDKSPPGERMFDMIAHLQSGRLDDQRCEPSKIPHPSVNRSKITDDKENSGVDRAFSDAVHSTNCGMSRSRGSHPSINPKTAVAAAAAALKATYRKASLVAYPMQNVISQPRQSQRPPTVPAEHRDRLFDLIAGVQDQRMDEQRVSLPTLALANGALRNPTNASKSGRGHVSDKTTFASHSSSSRNQVIESKIPETRNRKKSHSTTTVGHLAASPSARPDRLQKLSKHFPIVDTDSQIEDEAFLDSLMKYQSSRFDDQRSEFPKRERGN